MRVLADRGYLTTCGPADWPLAVDWALALRGGGLPVGAMVSDRVRAGARAEELALFDHLVPEPEGTGAGYRAILSVADASPYRRTLFTQTDVRAFSPPAALFDRLEGAGFALQGELLPADDPRFVYGLRIRDMTSRFPAPRYLKCQSGIIYFEKEAGRSVLGDCRELSARFPGAFGGIRRRWVDRLVNDEWMLGVVGGRRSQEIDLIGYPLPMAWNNLGLTPTTRRTPLLHLNTLPAASLMGAWLGAVRRARADAGLDPDASLAAWTRNVRKAAISERGWVRQRTPWSKLVRFRRWWRSVLQTRDAPHDPATRLALARHEEAERRGGWSDGEQRSWAAGRGSSGLLGRRLAQAAGVAWAGSQVVDLGCGPSPDEGLAGDAERWVGVDPLVKGRSRGRRTWVPGVAEDVPLPDRCADVITAVDVLDRVLDLDAALREVDRLLKPGGAFVVAARVEHYPDFGEAHTLRWTLLRDALPGWAWVREDRLETSREGVAGAVDGAVPFDMANDDCRAGVLVAVGRKPAGRGA